MFPSALVPLLRCPNDKARLLEGESQVTCPVCGCVYPIHDGYLEILPRAEFEHRTQYLDEAGGTILDYQEIGPPLLSAGIKNDLLNEFLRLSRADRVLDLGCGNGKFAYWNRARVAEILALDLAPWFAEAARRELPLLRGDMRALPFDDASFDKVFSIDVFEHLTREDLSRVLGEAQRILKPRGLLFVFSNTRERQTLWWAMRPQQAFTGFLRRRGAIDFRRDDWRKSDHVKAIATYPELVSFFAGHGLPVRRAAFWNGIAQGWVENVILKLGESLVSRRVRGGEPLARQAAARQEVRGSLASGRSKGMYLMLRALTGVMALDIKLFGRLRAGPYFVLAEKV